jgi:hypothetical protein
VAKELSETPRGFFVTAVKNLTVEQNGAVHDRRE